MILEWWRSYQVSTELVLFDTSNKLIIYLESSNIMLEYSGVSRILCVGIF